MTRQRDRYLIMNLVAIVALIQTLASTALHCDSNKHTVSVTSYTTCDNENMTAATGTSCDHAELVIAVRNHFHSGCVFIIYDVVPGSTEASTAIYGLQKCLATAGVASWPSDLLQATNKANCPLRRPLVVVASDSPDVRRRLKQVSEQVSYSRPRWLLFLRRYAAEDFLRDVNIPFDCEFLTIRGSNITESFRVAAHLPLQTRHWGVWDAAAGRLSTSVASLYERRNELNGMVMNTSTLHNPPINTVIRSGKMVTDVGGYIGKIWITIQKRLNFTSAYSVPPDNSWGSYSATNRNWSGMIAKLLSGDAHVAVCDFVMTNIRTTVIDFMAPLLITRSSVFMRKPINVQVKLDAYLQPFGIGLWMTLGLFSLLASLVITMCLYLATRFGKPPEKILRIEAKLLGVLKNSVFDFLGMLFQQGHEEVHHSWSSLFLFWSLYLTTMTILMAYCSDLTAALSTQTPSLPFTSFEGMLEDGSYRLGIVARSSLLDVFDKAEDKLLQKVYSKMVQPGISSLPGSMLEGFQRICTRKKYTFIHTFTTAMGLQKQLLCIITSVPQAGFPTYMSIAVAKESPYLGIFNHLIRGLRRSGALQRLYLQTWHLPNDQEQVLSSVKLLQVAPLLAVLLVGTAAATLLLAIERINRRSVVLSRENAHSSPRSRTRSTHLSGRETLTAVTRRHSFKHCHL